MWKGKNVANDCSFYNNSYPYIYLPPFLRFLFCGLQETPSSIRVNPLKQSHLKDDPTGSQIWAHTSESQMFSTTERNKYIKWWSEHKVGTQVK